MLALQQRIFPAQTGEAGKVAIGGVEYAAIFHGEGGQVSVCD
jgi:hypothetical protein